MATLRRSARHLSNIDEGKTKAVDKTVNITVNTSIPKKRKFNDDNESSFSKTKYSKTVQEKNQNLKKSSYNFKNEWAKLGGVDIDDKIRCSWIAACGGKTPLSKLANLQRLYHDNEWGTLTPDLTDRYLFEMLTLESAQAGLSWATILQKREAYRKAYHNFDPQVVSTFDKVKIEELMNESSGIVRNRLKIHSSISNAIVFLKISNEHKGFANYLGTFLEEKSEGKQQGFPIALSNGKVVVSMVKVGREIVVKNDMSDALSIDLKKKGIKFFGSTIAYAYLQAIGFVHDHDFDCFKRQAT
ncbi:hypothetical protein HK096_008589, partial [Nowakowskiella sp. JEL0078]